MSKKKSILMKTAACFIVVIILVITFFTVVTTTKSMTMVFSRNYLYDGTLDISFSGWSGYNAGLNFDLSGGTAGTLKQGAKLLVISENTNRYGNNVSYCYSEDLKKYCYVSSRYIVKDNISEIQEQAVLDISVNGWKTYNTGLNYNLTGGTAGTLKNGAKLIVINEKTNSYGNKVSYCYSEDLRKYCYISSKYIKFNTINSENTGNIKENTYRENIVKIALAEYEIYKNAGQLKEPIKYNYNYGVKSGLYGSPWCADFVCWCAAEAGIPMSIFPHEEDLKVFAANGYTYYGRYYNNYSLAYVPHLSEYLTKFCNAVYYSLGSDAVRNGVYIPQAGDLIIYGKNGENYMHIGLIVNYNSATKEITTIEGNTSSGSYTIGCVGKKVRTYNKADLGGGWYIQGYISPNY